MCALYNFPFYYKTDGWHLATPCFSTGMSRTVPSQCPSVVGSTVLVGKIYCKRPTLSVLFGLQPIPTSTEPSLLLVVFLLAVQQVQPALEITINVPVVYMGRYKVVLRGDYP